VDHTIKDSSGRTLSFTDYGQAEKTAVFWCHGGPGSRLEPRSIINQVKANLVRFIGIDRPGYGSTSPLPNRTINDWTSDLLTIANHLEIEKFYMVGVSTGGSYSLAAASKYPDKVLGVLVCCGMTDMRWAAKNSSMDTVEAYKGLSREQAYKKAVEDMGEDGSQMLSNGNEEEALNLAPADLSLLEDPEYLKLLVSNDATFAQGLTGYADDRLADCSSSGWSSFDVGKVNCPVNIIHGNEDTIVPVAHAQHTSEIVKNSMLKIFPNHGHLSVINEVNDNLQLLIQRVEM